MKKILLIGNPNVGKSVIFSHLTGIDVISSNYPGTTVEYTKGYLKVQKDIYEVIDVPGIYSLQPTTKSEEVAINILKDAMSSKDTIIINVLDSTNLERNLNLTLQLIKNNLPMIIVLNFCDEIEHKGISINYNKLEEIFGIPVIKTCARSGEGIKEIINKLKNIKISNLNFDIEKKWEKIGEITSQVQKITHRHHTLLDMISELSIHPFTGLPIAIAILASTFLIIRFLGENLIQYIFEPIFNNFYLPLLKTSLIKITKSNFIYNLLIGTTPEPMESFGILTTGLYIPLVVVLPYLLTFYFILSLLEDIGYLPRLAVMLDNFFHKLGIHGYSAIPILLGFGCKVPGILSIRILESKREKIIVTVLVLMLAPCMPQTAMIISILSPYGAKYLFFTFTVIFLNAIFIGLLLNKLLAKTEIPELFLEIPPYRMIHIPTLFKKLYIRIKDFFVEAVPLIFGGIILINIMELSGINNLIIKNFGEIFTYLLDLPKEIASVLILGFLRKDVSIALLTPFNLTAIQLVVASIFMVLYLPCISTFFLMIKEHGIITTIKITIFILISGFLLSFLINKFLKIF
ncbi:MAG: ferrous iron transporter B [Endomicrobia bacterium]|nr:ferrous iron transporter B [Endomicrobiia bacterium]